LRNNDTVARSVEVISPESAVFSISRKPGTNSKIASGMEAIYTVHFKPDSRKDFQYDLICSTDREKFVVPIRAIGARYRFRSIIFTLLGA
jgi:hydrocephalus-inducing protein